MTTDCAVIIPAGPADDVEDTLGSVLHFFGGDTAVIVVDDMCDPRRSTAIRLMTDGNIILVPATGPSGKGGKLWRRDCLGLNTALQETSAQVFLRLDADALVIGHGAGAAAAAHFSQHPDVGALGSCTRTCTGGKRDFSPAARAFRKHSSLARRALKRESRAIHALALSATANGWQPGEHALGAGVFLARRCVEEMAASGLLDPDGPLTQGPLEDDWILGAGVRAVGYRTNDFTHPGQPVAVAWQGLPQHPQELIDEGRCIIHSVRSYKSMDEHDIRGGFRALRQGIRASWPESHDTAVEKSRAREDTDSDAP